MCTMGFGVLYHFYVLPTLICYQNTNSNLRYLRECVELPHAPNRSGEVTTTYTTGGLRTKGSSRMYYTMKYRHAV